MIAMSLALRPSLLIADEPTTALDLTIQAQIIDLLTRLSEDRGMAVLFITHDLALMRSMVRRVLVMYAGLLVESGPTEDIFTSPLHPYTRALVTILSDPASGPEKLATIPGSVPGPGARPPGCPFHPRCDSAKPECRRDVPAVSEPADRRCVKCWLY
jgi:oligopeptide/dipeptide ABC transporter ATP-binding protein